VCAKESINAEKFKGFGQYDRSDGHAGGTRSDRAWRLIRHPQCRKLLYQKSCSGCHGDIEDRAKAGWSITRISSAIRMLHEYKETATLTDKPTLLITLALKDDENLQHRARQPGR
jgi:hypothetical protein